MANNLEELVIQLTAETEGLKSELKTAQKTTVEAARKMQDALKEFSENSTKNTNLFQSALASMSGFLAAEAVKSVLGFAKQGVGVLVGALEEGAQAAIAQETALTRLANSLAINGQYTKEAMSSLEEFADEQERLTGIADDVIAANLGVLSSMTKLEADGLRKAQKAALDFSAAMGIDLDTATRMVGKGIEGNFLIFKRYGIEVEGAATATERLSNIMAKIPTGASAGFLNTFAGSLRSAQNSVDNFAEAIASSITKNPVVVAMLQEIAKIFTELTTSANESAIQLREGFAKALFEVADVLIMATRASGQFIQIMTAGFKAIVTAAAAVLESVFAVADLLMFKLPDDPFSMTKASFESFVETAGEDTWASGLADNMERVADAGQASFGAISTSADTTSAAISNVTTKTRELTEAEKAHNEVVKAFSESLAQKANAVGAYYEFESARLKAARDQELITNEEYFATSQEQLLIAQEEERAAIQEAYAEKLISEQQYQDAKTSLARKQALDQIALNKERTDAEKAANKERAANFSSTLNTISTLQSTNSKELAAIGKAAAMTQATIDGYAAVQKALASAPPPFNFALAALVGTATAANVAKIASTGLKSGINSVPGIGTQDNFPAVLAPGERVVPTKTNEDLTQFLSEARESGPRQVNINISIQNNLPASREAGEQMIEQINEALAAGSLRLLNV